MTGDELHALISISAFCGITFILHVPHCFAYSANTGTTGKCHVYLHITIRSHLAFPEPVSGQHSLITTPMKITSIKNNRGGFTLVEIMIVVAIIAVLATIAVPSFLRARQRAQGTSILNELRQLNSGVDQFKIEHPGQSYWNADTQLRPYIKDNAELLFRFDGGPYIFDILDEEYEFTYNPTPPWAITGYLVSFYTANEHLQPGVPLTFWGSYYAP
jgi:prepilin-type N-terminal cleavage/methylation domain-containing protein